MKKKLSWAETKIIAVDAKVGIHSILADKMESVKDELTKDRANNGKSFLKVNSRLDSICDNTKALAIDMENRLDSKISVVCEKVKTVTLKSNDAISKSIV